MTQISQKADGQKVRMIGADINLSQGSKQILELLSVLKDMKDNGRTSKLALAGFRDHNAAVLVWNEVQELGLQDTVEYYPYSDVCRRFPFQKKDAQIWFDNQSSSSDFQALKASMRDDFDSDRTVLFVTYMHPWKPEGNSRLMRDWLEQFRSAGYRIHLLFYAGDAEGTVTPEMRKAARELCDFYLEVPINSNLVGWNRNGQNVHVDDWCGPELLNEVSELTRRFSYDIAFVNYAFLSAVFDRVAAYTHKVLLTHDRFEDRNRHLLDQGLSESAWMSLTKGGEALACERADSVIALQSEEAAYFKEIVDDPEKVVVVSPVLPLFPKARKRPGEKLRIGYFGSQNWVNEENLGDFMAEWAKQPGLCDNSEFILAGGICEQLDKFIDEETLKKANPHLMGKVPDLNTFFAECDIVINPERGGTGLKIKSLETMAYGMPLLSTAAGAVGFGSNSRYHSAETIGELAEVVAELALDRSLVTDAEKESRDVYDAYSARNKTAVAKLIGPSSQEALFIPPKQDWPPKPREVEIRSTPYIDQIAADYHFEQFKTVAERVDLNGKRVLEIGSDFHLISARLFLENGAESVVATNMVDLKSDEPLPAGLTFEVGDMGQLDLEEGGFDLIYGIAILEHIPDFKSVSDACKRFLAPDGVIYLQGCPMWGGSIGHHVWFNPEDNDDEMRTRFAAGGSKSGKEMMYSFSDSERNPIPNWAHLTHSPEELAELLKRDGIPNTHADGIVNYVYNLSGNEDGSFSNFKTASEIVEAFRSNFDVAVNSWAFGEEPNEHYQKALEKHSRYDLDTMGGELWLRKPEERERIENSFPKVSVIVPVFNMEDYLDECLSSLQEQDYPSIEIILVDDASTDGSAAIIERASIDDDRVKVLTNSENRGLGKSRNAGVDGASGEYIFFLDADDILAGHSVIRDLVNTARATNSEVVTGRANKFSSGQEAEPYDSVLERGSGAVISSKYSGTGAFRATFGQRKSGYLPMRAWGYLFKADLFKNFELDFPVGAHEDVGIVPMLCYLANKVHYLKQPIVNYRYRPESISNTAWSAAKSIDLVNIWKHFKEMLTRFGLEEEIGFASLLTAQQATLKIESHSVSPEELREICTYLGCILNDAEVVTDQDVIVNVVRHLTELLERFDPSGRLLFDVLSALPKETLNQYNRAMFGEPISEDLEEVDHSSNDPMVRLFNDNEAKANGLLNRYRECTDDSAKNYPCMLTEADKAVYYDAGRTYRGLGTIVDGGCFVGGTTYHLVQGLKDNPNFNDDDPALRKLIKVYDLFLIDEDYILIDKDYVFIGEGYILEHLERNFPGKEFSVGGSFEQVFREQLAENAQFLEVFPGDVMKSGYTFEEPIEVLGVDLCKALPVTDYVVRTFFPRLIPDGLVLQQDFIHEFHPHIHLSMMKLDDFFKLEAEMKWGGSVTFRLLREITPKVIEERFGQDESWYYDAETNVKLLEDLISRTFYDENRWIMILTLGFYYLAIGEKEKAKETYLRAVQEYPQLEPSEITTRLLYEE